MWLCRAFLHPTCFLSIYTKPLCLRCTSSKCVATCCELLDQLLLAYDPPEYEFVCRFRSSLLKTIVGINVSYFLKWQVTCFLLYIVSQVNQKQNKHNMILVGKWSKNIFFLEWFLDTKFVWAISLKPLARETRLCQWWSNLFMSKTHKLKCIWLQPPTSKYVVPGTPSRSKD